MINFWVNLSLKFPLEAASKLLNSSCFTLTESEAVYSMSARSSPSLQLHSVYTERNIQRQDSSVFFFCGCTFPSVGNIPVFCWGLIYTFPENTVRHIWYHWMQMNPLKVLWMFTSSIFFYSFVQTQTMMSLLTADQIGHVMCF